MLKLQLLLTLESSASQSCCEESKGSLPHDLASKVSLFGAWVGDD